MPDLPQAMRDEIRKLQDRATAYRMCGEHQLAEDLRFAAHHMVIACSALEIARAGEREC